MKVSIENRRSTTHFLLQAAVILTYVGSIDVGSGLSEYGLFALQILVIYIVVRFITYRSDLATANKINNKIKKMNILNKKEQAG